ncbi:MAG: DUF5915 domain-containing protein, partial [Trueperaceae bacterium]
PDANDRPAMDRWLVARLHDLTGTVTERLEAFDATTAARAIRDFVVSDLSNWYVRRNRKRFWKSKDALDQASAYHALHEALVTVAKLIAPMTPFLAETLYRTLVLPLDAKAPESVHLAAWPQPDPTLLDDDLLHDMRATVRLVELGRAARAQSGVKIRQPLPRVLVRARDQRELDGVRRFEAQLLDELNVKSVRYLDPTDAFLAYDVKPNLPLLGRRLGARIPALRAALSKADGREIAEAVGEGRSFVVELDGERLELEPEAFLLDARSPDGYAAVEERGYLAALDTTVDDDLRIEGVARDAIRAVQNARKNAGFEVADRVRLAWCGGDAELERALRDHRDAVADEVLATAVERVADASETDADHVEQVAGDGGAAWTVALTRVRG